LSGKAAWEVIFSGYPVFSTIGGEFQKTSSPFFQRVYSRFPCILAIESQPRELQPPSRRGATERFRSSELGCQ